MVLLTSLRRSEVLSRRGVAWLRSAGPLDAQRTTFINLTLQAFLSCIGLVSRHHVDETEATRVAGVGVAHDVALLDLAIFLEQTSDIFFTELRMDAGHEEVGASVLCFFFIFDRGWDWRAGQMISRDDVGEERTRLTDYRDHGHLGRRCELCHYRSHDAHCARDTHACPLLLGQRCKGHKAASLRTVVRLAFVIFVHGCTECLEI